MKQEGYYPMPTYRHALLLIANTKTVLQQTSNPLTQILQLTLP